ncbi:hypothetical protein BDW68DRAFT_35912 [Aspergillus falconensis]
MLDFVCDLLVCLLPLFSLPYLNLIEDVTLLDVCRFALLTHAQVSSGSAGLTMRSCSTSTEFKQHIMSELDDN